ncbi:hypothetical protein BDN72DRAFT_849596 [Pluteus cervinus]|uniref:Uncharacterized protein n=1 Tax=Pluteus cervinus TaxID=181527 RepID=A0ACD3A878_9AGAR|nr:hypothetical protein BDN72DRAFT_849596 [Pluteus cervinus]
MTLPNLPMELQDEIFRLAAWESPVTANILLQVSKWVSHRIEPILYEIIVIQQTKDASKCFYPPHIERLSSKVLDLFEQHGNYMRCLWIEPIHPEQDVASALKLCTSLKNLAFPSTCSTEMLEIIQEYPPQLERLSGMFSMCRELFDALKPAYRLLTHLDFIGIHRWNASSTFLTGLPSLTHLAVDDMSDGDDVVVGALKGCQKLQAMLLVGDDEDMAKPCEETSRVAEYSDERIVRVIVSPFNNWWAGVHGGVDMWKFADELISERRRRREELPMKPRP